MCFGRETPVLLRTQNCSKLLSFLFKSSICLYNVFINSFSLLHLLKYRDQAYAVCFLDQASFCSGVVILLLYSDICAIGQRAVQFFWSSPPITSSRYHPSTKQSAVNHPLSTPLFMNGVPQHPADFGPTLRHNHN